MSVINKKLVQIQQLEASKLQAAVATAVSEFKIRYQKLLRTEDREKEESSEACNWIKNAAKHFLCLYLSKCLQQALFTL